MNRIHTKPPRWRGIIVLHLLFGLLVNLSAVGQNTSLREGLVAYYPFNGNANDESGNGDNGTITGNVLLTTNRFGETASAFVFGGEQGAMIATQGKFLPSGNSDRTISAWIKPSSTVYFNASHPNSIGYYRGEILSFGKYTGSQGYNAIYLYSESKTAPAQTFVFGVDTEQWNKFASYISKDWYCVQWVYKQGLVSFYINGTKQALSRSAAVTLNTASGPLIIGASSFTPNSVFQGGIDDVRVYNRALSDTEVKVLYAYESTPPDNSFITNGLVAYYPFNGNANDESNGYNHGKTYNVAPANDRFGQSGKAFSFGGESYINIGPVISRYDSATFSAWFQTEIKKPSEMAIVSKPNNLNTFTGLRLGVYDSKVDIGFASDTGVFVNTVGIGGTLLNNNWHHAVAVSQGGIVRIYLDGKLESVKTQVDQAAVSTNDVLIGREFPETWKNSWGGWGARGFIGLIDDVRIYNRSLSDSEVKALYDYESIPQSAPPDIVKQPQTQLITTGDDATFCVTLKDSGAYNYQWQRNEQNIAGATLNCFTVNSVTAAMDGSRYRVIVSNSAGTIISDIATLTVVTPPPPIIATQPAPKTVQEGANVSLSVAATGQGSLVYQWQFNEQNLPGATSPTLYLNGVKLNMAGRYRVLVSSQYGVTISDTVSLKVNPNPPPTIVTQPSSLTPAEGTQISLTVTATGPGALSYQWQVNGQNIPGATSSTLVLSAVRPSANGAYRVIVGNPYGTTISTEATIAVVVTDSDSDGLSDYEELLLGTNPNKVDSDGDGLSDFAEVRTYKINPLTTDTDGDGYSDGIEVARDGNPNNRSVTPTGALAVFPAVDVEFYTLTGVKYQLEVSADMATWTPQGGVVVGTGGNQNHLVRAGNATRFWRLKVVQ